MTITEPATLLTDWALAALCVVLARRLRAGSPPTGTAPRGDSPESTGGQEAGADGASAVPSSAAPRPASPPALGWGAVRWLRLHLQLSAVGAVLGGIQHGFQAHLSAWADQAVWTGTLAALVLATGALVAFAVALWAAPGARRPLQVEVVLLVGLGLGIGVPTGAFAAILAVWIPALIRVALLAGRAAREGDGGARVVLGSLAVSLVGAAIQGLGLAPHPSFNHNDLFHVVQMAAVVLLVRGARQSLDARAERERAARIPA